MARAQTWVEEALTIDRGVELIRTAPPPRQLPLAVNSNYSVVVSADQGLRLYDPFTPIDMGTEPAVYMLVPREAMAEAWRAVSGSDEPPFLPSVITDEELLASHPGHLLQPGAGRGTLVDATRTWLERALLRVDATSGGERRGIPRPVRIAAEVIRARACERLTLADLAAVAGTSRFHLAHAFD